MQAPCSPTSLVAALAIAAALSLSITVAVYSPLGWLVPEVAWRIWGGFKTPGTSQNVSQKYNITVNELRTLLDPEPQIVVEDYVLDTGENEGGRANLTLYERAADVAARTLSAQDAEPWLTWAHSRFGDVGKPLATTMQFIEGVHKGNRQARTMLKLKVASKRVA